MNFLTEQDVLGSNKRYYIEGDRWSYFSHVIDLIKKYNMTSDPTKVLEIGPFKLTMVPGCDVLDILPDYNPKYVRDANDLPWPIADKQYDLVIGLQVFEHLLKHKYIFQEIERISKHCILSFPYKWREYKNHHGGIDESVIKYWTCNYTPVEQFVTTSKKKVNRIISYFRFGE